MVKLQSANTVLDATSIATTKKKKKKAGLFRCGQTLLPKIKSAGSKFSSFIFCLGSL